MSNLKSLSVIPFDVQTVREDFPVLNSLNITTIVSLLNPSIPYEAALLEKEQSFAAQHNIKVVNRPLTSILGQRLGEDYQKRVSDAARAPTLLHRRSEPRRWNFKTRS